MSLLALAAIAAPIAAQDGLARRIERHLAKPPLDRGHWGVIVVDRSGTVLYATSADRLFVPASNTKLVVTAAGVTLLPPDYRAATSVYAAGSLVDGVLHGDLVVYGRGDPTFSTRCYGIDTTAASACDTAWSRMDSLAQQIAARNIRHVRGAIVGDGSYFDGELYHPSWEAYDLNWWYAAPVSGLGFNDNSIDLTYRPGPRRGAPVVIDLAPDVGLFTLENRSRTLAAGARRTIDFYRTAGTNRIWAEGGMPLGARERTEYFAVPEPNLYFAAALRIALGRVGVSVGGPTLATHDSLRYASWRTAPPLAELSSRPLRDVIFPVLNSSQNWFAEMLLKTLGRVAGGDGSWDAGIEVERTFLIDSVGIDSTAFWLSDGSGLSSGNLLTPRALVTLLRYMDTHPGKEAFFSALPQSGEPGSLRRRFVGTPLEGRVFAKTGSIFHVNALSGYVDRPDGERLAFSVIVNNHTARSIEVLSTIDSVVVEMAR
jgi:D-alanyl-D-alanine carboxypeptidase/D-alanyl-D-alanine-endopeptidase (penicillin-binding protein 4)